MLGVALDCRAVPLANRWTRTTRVSGARCHAAELTLRRIMTSLLLSTLPGLGRRSSAGGFSSRLDCLILNRRGGNAVPWAACQQIRFTSGEKDNYEDDHYKTLGLKPSDSTEKIRRVGNALRIATHSDHNKKIIDNDKFIKVNAAVRVLRNPEKKAKYDPIWWSRYGVSQANTGAHQQAVDALRTAAAARDAARRRDEAKQARDAAEAADAKKRDEERKAKKRAKREAQRAEAERQKKAAEQDREENERRAAIEAAKAAEEKKKRDKEIARKKDEAANAAAARKAAVEARAAELERQRKREARRVVLRHIPIWAGPWDVTHGLHPLQPGRILDFGVGEGTAWVEFWTAEEAQALQRLVTETDQLVILGKTIKTASIYPGRVKPPEGPDFITRSLYIVAPNEFLDGEEKLAPVVRRKLATHGFTTQPVGINEETWLGSRYLVGHYASVALAQSAKAALEKHFPELRVSYIWDHCERGFSTGQRGAAAGAKSSKKDSDSWFEPVDFMTFVVWLALAIFMAINKDESSDKEAQQKKEGK